MFEVNSNLVFNVDFPFFNLEKIKIWPITLNVYTLSIIYSVNAYC